MPSRNNAPFSLFLMPISFSFAREPQLLLACKLLQVTEGVQHAKKKRDFGKDTADGAFAQTGTRRVGDMSEVTKRGFSIRTAEIFESELPLSVVNETLFSRSTQGGKSGDESILFRDAVHSPVGRRIRLHGVVTLAPAFCRAQNAAALLLRHRR